MSNMMPEAEMPLVEIKGLSRVYPQGQRPVVALANLDCRVCPGARIAVTGPSGSGKSTLLHIIAGLDQPTTGQITWPALGPRGVLRPRQIGLAFQVPSLVPSLSVLENVQMPLLLMGEDLNRARLQAVKILEQLELGELQEKLPDELSGGQAQRVGIARAVVHKPMLVLADEPTGQLDHATADHLFDLLLAFLDRGPSSLLVATHDPLLAGRLQSQWRMAHGTLEVDR